MTAVDHEHAARLVTHLSQQRSSGKYCDVCVCVAEQRFLAHKCVLSANSDQLDALILDATDEDNTSHDIEIEIHGVSPVGFEIVLEYFYTGVLRLEPLTVTHTWMTAVYLGLPDIVTRCSGYCQQSVCVTAHPRISNAIQAFPSTGLTVQAGQGGVTVVPAVDVNNNGDIIPLPEAESNRTVPAQLSTTSVLSTSTTRPKVSSEVKVTKATLNEGKNPKPEPFEIRENQSISAEVKDDSAESVVKKPKLVTMDESAIAWNPYNSHASANGPAAGMTIPVSSMPQVVVNLVQGYQYQPVDLNWAGQAQQWAHVQVGKGQFVTTGMIPVASQVKHEPVLTPATAVQIVNPESGTNGGENSPMSYTTLSLVSQDPPSQTDTRAEMETVPVERATTEQEVAEATSATETNNTMATPLTTAIVPRNHAVMPTQELNLDSIHFTQIQSEDGHRATPTQSTYSPATTSATYIQPVTLMNNMVMSNSSGDDTTQETILMQSQVEQLRIQHQQLQRLQLETENSEGGETVVKSSILATSKRKRKAPTKVSKSEDGNGDTHELHAHSNVRKSRSLVDAGMVNITRDHMDYLYQKYPEIKKEPLVAGSCDVMQLLQHGKARQRKSSEQNALNNTIRTILDTTGIVESGDARVQDAVCLIMDRFAVLQEHMNDTYVRKQLTIKVKHSIHCKKWRLKRHKMKQLEMSSSSSPDGGANWMPDQNNLNVSLTISNNSLLNEESLHS